MLQNIYVKNLALIDAAEVNFDGKLNILTGETGAGKSIVIGAIGMALGGKVSKDMIRKGADYALAELYFTVENGEILQALREMELPVDDDTVTISRRITGSRSVSRINGEMVSMSVLKEVGALLMDIHGQHEHQSLLHKEKHLEILDKFAKEAIGTLKEAIREAYHNYAALKKEMGSAITDEKKRLSEMDFLKYQIEEIEHANLCVGEEEELDKLFRKMSNARQLLESASTVHELTGYDASHSAGNLVGRALRELYSIEKYDEAAAGLINQLADIDGLLNDFNRELAEYEASLSFDESAYHETEDRLGVIHRLKSKYGKSVEKVLEHQAACQAEFGKLMDYEQYLSNLENRFSEAESVLKQLSCKLSEIRRQGAEILEKRITEALVDLNFLDVRFEISCKNMEKLTDNGQDEIEFLISTNPGESLKPLNRVASGGELSRIMLAVKSVLADADAVETLIFDEIDTGISGRTAQKVSEKMAVIARKHQVICITHLPQIAAMADAHYVIEKRTADDRTVTDIYRLSEEASVNEIARLLGGVAITQTVYENAREMKKLAQEMK